MDIDVQIPNCTDSDSVSFRVSFAAALQLGPESVGLPIFGMEGELASEGCSQLRAMTTAQWVPLEAVLPVLVVPQLFGNLSFCNGTVSANVTNTPLDVAVVDDYLELIGIQMWIMVAEFTPGDVAVPKVEISARSDVVVGGDLGFAASMTGTLNTELETATLTMSHGGGWSPLQPPLSGVFFTPAFECAADLGVGAYRVSVECDVAYTAPIVIAEGVLEVHGASGC